MAKLRVLDLFSGIGGFSLGLERTGGFETVAFCEIEDFPRKVLAKHWPNVPQFTDVRKLTKDDIDGPVDVICGGYPCQPFSTAGRRRGKEDDRHLWPEFNRLVAELRPSWVIGENVAGHISMGLDDVLSDLEGQGYACRTFVIPACAVDAPHRRDRVWVIGHADKNSWQQSEALAVNTSTKQHNGECIHTTTDAKDMQRNGRKECRQPGERQKPKFGKCDCGISPNSDSKRQSGSRPSWEPISPAPFEYRETNQPFPVVGWPTEPAICGADDGVPDGVDRLRALGNAVVPQVVEMIGYAILEADNG